MSASKRKQTHCESQDDANSAPGPNADRFPIPASMRRPHKCNHRTNATLAERRQMAQAMSETVVDSRRPHHHMTYDGHASAPAGACAAAGSTARCPAHQCPYRAGRHPTRIHRRDKACRTWATRWLHAQPRYRVGPLDTARRMWSKQKDPISDIELRRTRHLKTTAMSMPDTSKQTHIRERAHAYIQETNAPWCSASGPDGAPGSSKMPIATNASAVSCAIPAHMSPTDDKYRRSPLDPIALALGPERGHDHALDKARVARPRPCNASATDAMHRPHDAARNEVSSALRARGPTASRSSSPRPANIKRASASWWARSPGHLLLISSLVLAPSPSSPA